MCVSPHRHDGSFLRALYLSSRFQPALRGNSSKNPEQALAVYEPQAHPDFQMESVTVADAAIYGVITA